MDFGPSLVLEIQMIGGQRELTMKKLRNSQSVHRSHGECRHLGKRRETFGEASPERQRAESLGHSCEENLEGALVCGAPSSALAFGRERVVPVRAAFSNLPVPAMNQEFCLLVHSDLASTGYGFGLCSVDRRRTRTPGRLHSPAVTMRHYMLPSHTTPPSEYYRRRRRIDPFLKAAMPDPQGTISDNADEFTHLGIPDMVGIP